MIHYDYQALDRLLTDDSDPVELGNQLDEIMEALAVHAAQDGGYHTQLEGHYYVLRVLRNIFWKLREAQAWR
jgi:hypothetical protein